MKETQKANRYCTPIKWCFVQMNVIAYDVSFLTMTLDIQVYQKGTAGSGRHEGELYGAGKKSSTVRSKQVNTLKG